MISTLSELINVMVEGIDIVKVGADDRDLSSKRCVRRWLREGLLTGAIGDEWQRGVE